MIEVLIQRRRVLLIVLAIVTLGLSVGLPTAAVHPAVSGLRA